jgi:hypothetical protein
MLGLYDEAEPLARLGRELGDEQDAATQMVCGLPIAHPPGSPRIEQDARA